MAIGLMAVLSKNCWKVCSFTVDFLAIPRKIDGFPHPLFPLVGSVELASLYRIMYYLTLKMEYGNSGEVHWVIWILGKHCNSWPY